MKWCYLSQTNFNVKEEARILKALFNILMKVLSLNFIDYRLSLIYFVCIYDKFTYKQGRGSR